MNALLKSMAYGKRRHKQKQLFNACMRDSHFFLGANQSLTVHRKKHTYTLVMKKVYEQVAKIS